MTSARQSNITFKASNDASEYECIICYNHLTPTSGFMQTACCLKLACNSCMMKAFYHSVVSSQESIFKCPMCRSTVVEIQQQRIHHTEANGDYDEDGLIYNLAYDSSNPSSDGEASEEDNLPLIELNTESRNQYRRREPTVDIGGHQGINTALPRLIHNMQTHRISSRVYDPSIRIEPSATTLSCARYHTWSTIHGRVTLSYFVGAPNSVLVSMPDIDYVESWYSPEYIDLIGVWITPFNNNNPYSPSYVIMISKPIAHEQNRNRVIITELNTKHIIANQLCMLYTEFPHIQVNHKTDVTFRADIKKLIIKHNEVFSDIHNINTIVYLSDAVVGSVVTV